jgi:MFS superfamily sulfate permease-like transporter
VLFAINYEADRASRCFGRSDGCRSGRSQGVAYATIAGLPVQVGLYTAIVPMAVYAALGTSRPLSVSTTTTIAILSATALGVAAPNGSGAELITAAATLAMLVGLLLLLAGALRLGFIANFISEPVLTRFKSAIGLSSWSIRFRNCFTSARPDSFAICWKSASSFLPRPSRRSWWPSRCSS